MTEIEDSVSSRVPSHALLNQSKLGSLASIHQVVIVTGIARPESVSPADDISLLQRTQERLSVTMPY